MKPTCFLFIFICSVFSLAAQEVDNTIYSMERSIGIEHNTFLFSTNFSFASNSMTNELIKTYFLNRFITDEMKNNVSKNLDDHNRLGGEFTNEFYFKHKTRSLSGNYSWLIGIKNINHIDSKFTRDLFEIYFRGNKNYAGRNAELAPFSYTLLKYQQLQFGVARTLRRDSTFFTLGAAIGMNKGQQLLKISSDRSALFTEIIGEYLDVNSSVEIHKSDSGNTGFGAFNGFGFSMDLFFKASVKNKNFFFARISNLGFIRWNNQSTAVVADTTFRFEGVDVSSLFNFEDSIKSIFTADSLALQGFLTKRKYQTYTLFLPAKIEFLYKHALEGKPLRIGIGADYMLNANYLPKVYLLLDYFHRRNTFTVNISYGGYTTFGAGIRYATWFMKGYDLSVGSNYITSLFNLDKSRSQNVFISLYKRF